MTISLKIPQPSVTKISLKKYHFKYFIKSPGANELKHLPWVVGCCPLAMIPSQSWMILGMPMMVLEWYCSYDKRTRNWKMFGIKVSECRICPSSMNSNCLITNPMKIWNRKESNNNANHISYVFTTVEHKNVTLGCCQWTFPEWVMEHSVQTTNRLTSCLQMPWLLVSPDYQAQWHWLYMTPIDICIPKIQCFSVNKAIEDEWDISMHQKTRTQSD